MNPGRAGRAVITVLVCLACLIADAAPLGAAFPLPEMIPIPPGSFLMGSTEDELAQARADFEAATGHAFDPDWIRRFQKRELPAHRVVLSKGFLLARTEVTIGQFQAFVRATGYRTGAGKEGVGWVHHQGRWVGKPGASWRDPLGQGKPVDPALPVVQVSRADAEAYITWLNTLGHPRTYRLPSEAEWEYACRGGGPRTLYPWGNVLPPEGRPANLVDESSARVFGWPFHLKDYDDGHPAYAPAGSFAPSGYGLKDMIGNVWEWTADFYGEYPSGEVVDPRVAGARRGAALAVIRGGSFGLNPIFCRTAVRGRYAPVQWIDFLGFRVAADAH